MLLSLGGATGGTYYNDLSRPMEAGSGGGGSSGGALLVITASRVSALNSIYNHNVASEGPVFCCKYSTFF